MIAWLKELLAGPSGAAPVPLGSSLAAAGAADPSSAWGREPGPRQGASVVANAQHRGTSPSAATGSSVRAKVSIGGEAETLAKQLVLVIDLNVCVGCHACVTSCKEWNTSGSAGPLVDENAYGASPTGTFFNRVQTYEAGVFPATETIHFPKSCLHCEDPPCVPVCPTGASYKRKEDGIVLVDYDKCIGCKYCAWACPYGMRELDEERQVMTKCTLCVDRIYNEELVPEDRKPACVKACPTNARLFGDIKDPMSEVSIAVRERGGYSLMPEWDTRPANQYLPRRPTPAVGATTPMPSERDRVLGDGAHPTPTSEPARTTRA